jgi:hypothetical protein
VSGCICDPGAMDVSYRILHQNTPPRPRKPSRERSTRADSRREPASARHAAAKARARPGPGALRLRQARQFFTTKEQGGSGGPRRHRAPIGRGVPRRAPPGVPPRGGRAGRAGHAGTNNAPIVVPTPERKPQPVLRAKRQSTLRGPPLPPCSFVVKPLPGRDRHRPPRGSHGADRAAQQIPAALRSRYRFSIRVTHRLPLTEAWWAPPKSGRSAPDRAPPAAG